MNNVSWHDVYDYVSDISAAGSRDEFLVTVLSAFERLVPFDTEATFVRVAGPCLRAVGASEKRLNDYNEYYRYRNPFILDPALRAWTRGAESEDWATRYRDTEFYRDFMLPGGAYKTLACPLPGSDLAVALHRSRLAPMFSETDKATLAAVAPQIRNLFFIWCTVDTGAAPPTAELIALSFDRLTRREAQIASLLHAGVTPREIADRLFISRRTVDSHVAHIYDKLNVHSRVSLRQAILRARAEPACGVRASPAREASRGSASAHRKSAPAEAGPPLT